MSEYKPMSRRLHDALERSKQWSPRKHAEVLAEAGLIKPEEIDEVARRLAAASRRTP